MKDNYQGNAANKFSVGEQIDRVATGISSQVHQARVSASCITQERLFALYRTIGDELLNKSTDFPGDEVLSHVSLRLKQCYPFLKDSFTVESLKAMRQLAYALRLIGQPDLGSIAFDRLLCERAPAAENRINK
ncbi:MAG: hypothetical protein AB7M93_26125 [Candidatus Obscuribacterales bacterium]